MTRIHQDASVVGPINVKMDGVDCQVVCNIEALVGEEVLMALARNAMSFGGVTIEIQFQITPDGYMIIQEYSSV